MGMVITANIMGAMGIITENKPHSCLPRSARLTALGIGVAGLGLCLAGAVRLAAALIALGPQGVVDRVYSGMGPSVTAAEMIGAADKIALSSTFVANAELQAARSQLLLRAASPSDRTELWRQARLNAEQVLKTAPSQPSLWLALAHIRRAEGDDAGAVAALRLSMLSGPFVPELMVNRTALGLLHLSSMDPDTRNVFRRQVRLTWLVSAPYVAALRDQARYKALVDDALRDLSDEEIVRGKRIHGMEPPPLGR